MTPYDFKWIYRNLVHKQPIIEIRAIKAGRGGYGTHWHFIAKYWCGDEP
jgi:hypothetical protein